MKLRLIFFCVSIFLLRGVSVYAQNFWEQTNGPYDALNSYVTNYIALIVDSSGNVSAGTQSGIYLTTDNGNTWTSSYGRGFGYSFAISRNGNIYAGISDGPFQGGVLRSTNNGRNWVNITTILDHVYAIAINSSGHLFAGVEQGAFRSTDDGATWTKIFPGPNDTAVLKICVGQNGYIYLSSNGISRIYRSSDNGNSWTGLSKGLGNYRIRAIVNGESGKLFAAGDSVYRSIDDGDSWTTVNPPVKNLSIYTLSVNPKGYMFLGTDKGVFLSIDNGDNWQQINSGLTDISQIEAIACGRNGYVYASTLNYGVFRSIKSTTGVKQFVKNKIEFSNYPNPSFLSTKIILSLPEREFISLKVFDAIGKEIAVLSNDYLDSGNYELLFNSYGLPNGTYFIRLQSQGFSQIKELILLH